MKRPLFICGITAVCVSAVCCLAHTWSVAIAGLGVGLLVLGVPLRDCKYCRAWIPVGGTILCVLGVFLIQQYCLVLPLQRLTDQKATVTGIVVEEPVPTQNSVRYILRVESVTGVEDVPAGFKMSLSDSSGLYAKLADRIRADVTFYKAEKSFLYSSYADGVFSHAYTSGRAESQATGRRVPFQWAYEMRDHIRSFFYSRAVSFDEATILIGMTLGDKTDMDDALYDNIKTSGVAHMFAVSGMHLSIICASLLSFLRFLKCNPRLAALLTAFAVFVVMAVTGFSASILRAGILFVVMLLGYVIFRQPDSLNSLGLAVLLMLLVNPYFVLDLSFQLSVTSTLGVILLTNRMTEPLRRRWTPMRWYQRLLYHLIQAAAMSLAAGIFTMPVCIYYFGYISVLSVLTNVLLTFPVMFALIFAVLGSCFSYICMPLGLLFSHAAGYNAAFMKHIVSYIGGLPYAVLYLSKEEMALCVCMVVCVCFGIWLVYRAGFRLRFFLLTAALSFLLSVTLSLVCRPLGTTITLLDTDTPIVAVVRNRRCLLIGAGKTNGDSGAVSRFLKQNGVRQIDMLILPALERAYAGGLVALAASVPIKTIAAPQDGAYKEQVQCLSSFGYSVQTIDAQVNRQLWNDTNVRLNSYAGALSVQLSIDAVSVGIALGSAQTDQWKKEDALQADLWIGDGVAPKGAARVLNTADATGIQVYRTNGKTIEQATENGFGKGEARLADSTGNGPAAAAGERKAVAGIPALGE